MSGTVRASANHTKARTRGGGSPRRRRALAGDAWGQIARLFLSQQDRREQVAAELGLTGSDLISLFHVRPDEGVAQRDLAAHWRCDPSWVTSRIDRLEALGLVERKPSPTDRRVKLVMLTADGVATRQAGLDAFNRPPAPLLELSTSDLQRLRQILGKLDLPDPTEIRVTPPTGAGSAGARRRD